MRSGEFNDEGLVDGVVTLEGLTRIRVGHVLVCPLLDCGMLELRLDMHSGLAEGGVKRMTVQLQLQQPAKPE